MGDALDDLIKAVEAGRSLCAQDENIGLDWGQRQNLLLAANCGSLDAALKLHQALLPGWDYSIQKLQTTSVLAFVQDDGGPESVGVAANPARAWLLAVLKALENQHEK